MNKKIQSQVLKEINAESRRELKKWINEGGRIDEYISEKYGSHVKKAISRTIELMQEQVGEQKTEFGNQTRMRDKSIEEYCMEIFNLKQKVKEQKADFQKMIEDLSLTFQQGFDEKMGRFILYPSEWKEYKDKILAKLGDDNNLQSGLESVKEIESVPEDTPEEKTGATELSSGVCICGKTGVHTCNRLKFEEAKK